MVANAEDRDRPTGVPQRILIIEDNHDAADSLGQILKLLGHEVRVVYTGLDGVRMAGEWLPTIVLSDIGLPELDGFQVARALREKTATASAKIIALSAYGSEEDRRQAQRAGFDNYLTKPADFKTLQELLDFSDHSLSDATFALG